ncbi:O-antigen polysaccharide polymerase Wzy family protein [Heyndrickxia sporothermodurans]|uniref:O-antigen polysaccharide polymerase Wzy family protein n=1 Tax=Heyndrickxia sporothermodurans TaxID=46224 RepID=UPI002DBC8FD0|nr:O-antigen polysaccharide polymerase Wzy family protein [Heyndrickxia sporothermodurans]MEB6548867.1 O-antigen polysaccharide polymerase Wzy family protein [Heyndrickxia sporothermodurans]
MLKALRYIILLFSVCMFFIGVIFNNPNVILTAICSLLIHNLWYSTESFSDRIIFFAFNITFFTFLVARLVIKTITNYKDIYNDNKFGLDFNNDLIIWNIFIVLFISLLFLYIGYSLLKSNNKIRPNKFKGMISGLSINSIAFTSKFLFYFTFIFNVLVLLDQARFTSQAGYTELYSSYSSSYPYFVDKLAEMCPAALFMYLATFPNKRKSFIPLMLYLLLGTLSLAVGNRNIFVLNILIVIIYLCLRNFTDKSEKWFGKKEVFICIGAIPFLIILLNAVSYFRQDSTMTTNSFIDIICDFFYKQGVSVNLIGYAQSLASQLPDMSIYTFGRLTDFLRNNIITQSLFDLPKYTSQTIESALYGNSFADSVSYILSPNRYINGWGYGSSYVAELFKDFGYIGVGIGNFMLGIILALMSKLFRINVICAWISLTMTRLLLYAPRDTATSFIVSTFSLINMLTIVIIILGSILLEGKKVKSSNLVIHNAKTSSNN